MIWHSSQFIGVGIAKFPYDNTYVVVVQYQPPGNINTPGKFRLNVPVPIARKNPKLKENCALDDEPSINDTLENEFKSVKTESELATDTGHIKPTDNTSESETTQNKFESDLIDQIPDDISIIHESLKDPLFPSNTLKETDREKVYELQGTDNSVKQKASPCISGEWLNGTDESQIDEFVTGQNGTDLIDNVFAGLTEKEIDIVIADSPEDNTDDDLEN